ncbi:MAG: hypothetical protein U5L03_14415 [Burkholderiaceae bacterium]|nr:hypothetical protein [Burkholderiaceae bacterium]
MAAAMTCRRSLAILLCAVCAKAGRSASAAVSSNSMPSSSAQRRAMALRSIRMMNSVVSCTLRLLFRW